MPHRLSLAHLTVLNALLDALPPWVPIGVEAPGVAFAALSPVERGRLCGAAARRFLDAHAQHASSP